MSSEPLPPSRWEKLAERPQLQTRIFDVMGTRYRHPARAVEREFVVINAPDWVNVVALTTDRHIVLVRQFRYGIDEFSLEIPGGVIDAGEDPVVAGLRELREETGYSGAPAKLLGNVRPNPAMQSNRCHFVFVEQAVKSHELEWDQDEEIQVLTLPADDVLAMAHAGGIVHSLVLNALMLFEPHWRAMQRRPGGAASGTGLG
jgi:8-oxo-dGTP pyrophosphatase MutT (NUDIX family)